MRTPARREADTAVVLAKIGKPKPAKQKRGKSYYENKLQRLNRELVFWRDGGICVEKETDGAGCSGGMELGHIIRRSDSAWLKRLFWNLVVQCNGHNCFHGDPLLHKVVGELHMNALRDEMVAHRSEVPDIDELQRRIAEVTNLLDMRPVLHDKATLIECGYYGQIIADAWAERVTA